MQRRRPALLILLALLVGTVAGCIGNEDAAEPDSEDSAVPQATESTGAIAGEVLSVDLEVMVGISVGLVNREGPLAKTDTDKFGRYTFNDVEPGEYRLQISDACCRTASRQVTVVPGNVSLESFQLERLTPKDLRTPHVVERQWDGFVACEASVLSQADDTCGAADANRDDRHLFNVTEGLQEIVFGMDWTQVGTSLMPDLRIKAAHPGGYSTQANYGVWTGPPPLIGHIRDEAGTNPTGRFDLINETLDIAFSVSSGNTNVVYQQPFTVHWAEFYFMMAPEDYSPLPDG